MDREKENRHIFQKIDDFFHQNNTKEAFRCADRIFCRFDSDLDYYTFYRENEDNQPVAIVYVTLQYLKTHENPKVLEKTVFDYLNSKEGMQATFKTSGIEESCLYTF